MADKCLVVEYTVPHEWVGRRKCEYRQSLSVDDDFDVIFSNETYLGIKGQIEKEEKQKVSIISLRIESDEKSVMAVVDITCSNDGGFYQESMYFGSDWGLCRHEIESKDFLDSVKSRLEAERGLVVNITSVSIVEEKEPPI